MPFFRRSFTKEFPPSGWPFSRGSDTQTGDSTERGALRRIMLPSVRCFIRNRPLCAGQYSFRPHTWINMDKICQHGPVRVSFARKGEWSIFASFTPCTENPGKPGGNRNRSYIYVKKYITVEESASDDSVEE